MNKVAVVENKISSLQAYLEIARSFESRPRDELDKNLEFKAATERYLYLIVQASIDIAEAFISYRGYRKPKTLAASFRVLGEQKILDQKLVEKLVSMVGFRNILAHDYERIRNDILYSILQEDLQDIEQFINCIKTAL